MKSQANSRKNLISCFILSVMMTLSAMTITPIQAQTSDASHKSSFGNTLRKAAAFFCQPFISLKSQKSGPYDVIIVPGIPYDEEKGAGMIMKARIAWANYLVSKGIAKNVIFSGSAVYSPYIESRIMAIYAEELGIPAENIFCETQAEHSVENVVYSIRLAENLGFKKIAIATGPFQSMFLSTYVKDHNLQVSFIPLSLTALGNAEPAVFSEIDPSSAHVQDFVSLTERESKEEQHEGTMGNKIEF
jgi:uncharacterized SAM-binding protein YcdF (DUF218 family)